MGEPDAYGFALLEPRDLSEFLKKRKCRAKRLLSYRDAHKQLFYDAVKGAKALPFYPPTVRSYEIFVCTDGDFASPAGYEVAFKRDRLHFAPQSGSVILASFDALQYLAGTLKSGELELGYECQSGAAGKIRKFNFTLKLGLQSGAYELCAAGLKTARILRNTATPLFSSATQARKIKISVGRVAINLALIFAKAIKFNRNSTLCKAWSIPEKFQRCDRRGKFKSKALLSCYTSILSA